MPSVALLCSVVLCVMQQSPPAAGPTVTALEFVEVRQARLKPKTESAMRRFDMVRPGLKLVLEVRGADVVQASHFGLVELESATDDKGDRLKLNDAELSYNDIREEFVAIDRDQMSMGESDPPKDVIRIELPLESPARAATAVSVRGKLQLKRVETVDVLIDTTPGEAKHEQLEKLGVKLKIVKAEEANQFTFETSGKLDALQDAELVDAQGKPLETHGSSSFGDNESVQRSIWLAQPAPANAKLKLKLVTKAQNVPVTFDLKDLKLP